MAVTKNNILGPIESLKEAGRRMEEENCLTSIASLVPGPVSHRLLDDADL